MPRVCLPSLIWLLLTFLSQSARADIEASPKARAHFDAGVSFLQDPDGAEYEEAYREFTAAYAESPSWKILGNLGLSAMKLERDGEAIAAFEKYLAEGTLDPDERRVVERDLHTLRASAAKVTIRFSQTGASLSDERVPVQGSPVRNRYAGLGVELQLWVRSGHHRLVASMPGRASVAWEIDATPGSEYSKLVELRPAATPPNRQRGESRARAERPIPASVYVGLAATVLVGAGAGVTGSLALANKREFDEANTGGDEQRTRDLADRTKTLNLTTDVLIGAALLGAGVTAYLFVTRAERPAAEQTGRSLHLAPRVGQNELSVDLAGAF